jgi:2-oxoisovalerate dehydrogenase E2 component (dihydrolipoyl transacylase)
MATTITMPQLGETVTEGTVAQWLKKPGDTVEKYEPFVEIATDKVSAEMPAPVGGIIREFLVREGQTVPTGAAIAIIDEIARATAVPLSTSGAKRFSPAVRRLAREHQIDLRAMRGSGANGRITAKDVSAASAHKVPAAPLLGETAAFTQARRLIAERMLESKRTIPHAWTMMEIDVTNVWKLRAREKDAFERAHGVKLTLLPFFIRAAAAALTRYPLMNARFTEKGLYMNPEINISIAVGMEGNLLLPVIRHADTLSIGELALATASLAEKARTGKLAADDLAFGTFTVNNTGAYGSVLSAPIIPLKQTAVITMEAVVKRAVVREDDAIAVRSMMHVCLSLDHRVVDGSIACPFLADIKQQVEKITLNDTV